MSRNNGTLLGKAVSFTTVCAMALFAIYIITDSKTPPKGVKAREIAGESYMEEVNNRAETMIMLQELRQISWYYNDYYRDHGSYPDLARDLDIPDQFFKIHDEITNLTIANHGDVIITVDGKFGTNKTVRLSPKVVKGFGRSKDSVELKCTTNLDRKYLNNGPASGCPYNAKL